MAMGLIKDMELPKDIVFFAYGMEDSLGRFYKEASKRTGDQETAQLFLKLAGIEKQHKKQLLDLFRTISGAGFEQVRFENRVIHDILEGGLSSEELAEKFTDKESLLTDVYSVAMMLEAQAMDLYMRYSEQVTQEDAKRLLYKLAQQEKAHLKSLGEMMNKKV